MPVEPARKKRNPAAARDRAFFPITPRLGIEIVAQEGFVELDILRAVGIAEKAAEMLIARQAPRGLAFQLVERDMGRIEVERGDAPGIRRQIRHHIATPRRDRDDMLAGFDRHRFHVHFRVFPDLGIDQPGEEKREEPFGQTFARHGLVAMHGMAQPFFGIAVFDDDSRI